MATNSFSFNGRRQYRPINSFSFNGIDCRNYCFSVADKPTRHDAPAREYTKYQVPGRNGILMIDNGRYKEFTEKYVVYGPVEYMTEFKNALFAAPQNAELMDTFDEFHYRLATFASAVQVSNGDMENVVLTVEFICRPERFLLIGNEAIEMQPLLDENQELGVQTLWNPTSYAASPLVIVSITAGGSGTVTLNGVTVTISGIPTNQVYLDFEHQDAYQWTSNLNAYISGDYGKLIPGTNSILFTGDITSISIIPRWWEL